MNGEGGEESNSKAAVFALQTARQSFSLISLKGRKHPKWKGGTAGREPGLELGSCDRKSWELEELRDLGQHGRKPGANPANAGRIS